MWSEINHTGNKIMFSPSPLFPLPPSPLPPLPPYPPAYEMEGNVLFERVFDF